VPIRVLLVEDHDVYRETLEFLLRRYADIVVVGAVADGSSAARACAELDADVVVIDYRLPDMDGATAAAEVVRSCPGSSVVFLSASAGAEERETARIAGMAFVRKDEGVETLLRAVRAAARRGGGRESDH
jgi:DNA-binding NarL/FixJ family response regulator